MSTLLRVGARFVNGLLHKATSWNAPLCNSWFIHVRSFEGHPRSEYHNLRPFFFLKFDFEPCKKRTSLIGKLRLIYRDSDIKPTEYDSTVLT